MKKTIRLYFFYGFIAFYIDLKPILEGFEAGLTFRIYGARYNRFRRRVKALKKARSQ